jgi:nucleotide-binding universal stress UspA family protein
MSPSILLPLASYPDATPAAGLLRAFDLAATLQAKVTSLVHEVDIPDVRSLLGYAIIDVPEMIAIAEQRSRAQADELTGTAEAVARRFQMEITVRRWRGTLDRAPSYLAKAARFFDHTFLVPAEGSGEQLEVAEGVLFGSGGPVWLFPADEATGHLESVAIAWDGGRAAARAVRDALPVLGQTKHVTIVAATDDKPMDELLLPELQRHLAEHCLEVSTELFSRGDRPVGAALQQAALDAGAGLLVMGAYGHNRFREFVLGGATKSVLSERKLPILMSH